MIESFDAFFADFGLDVNGGATVFRAIFDASYNETLGIDNASPVLQCRDTDAAANGLAHGSAIAVSGTSYTVRGVQPDGTGLTRLILERA